MAAASRRDSSSSGTRELDARGGKHLPAQFNSDFAGELDELSPFYLGDGALILLLYGGYVTSVTGAWIAPICIRSSVVPLIKSAYVWMDMSAPVDVSCMSWRDEACVMCSQAAAAGAALQVADVSALECLREEEDERLPGWLCFLRKG